MLNISKEQFDVIEFSYKHQRKRRLATLFKEKYSALAAEIQEDQLIQKIDFVIDESKEIDITGDNEIVECVAIAYLLSKNTFSQDTLALIARTLSNRTWNARTRLDFIWKICSTRASRTRE